MYSYRDYIAAQGGADIANASCGNMPQAGDPNTSILAASGTLSSTTPQATHSFDVPAGTSLLRIAMNAVDDGSNFDLYVKQGSPPTTSDYDRRANGSGQFAFFEFASPAADTWWVLIDRVAGQGIYQVTTTIFATGAPSGGSDGQTCDDQNACTDNDICQRGVCAGATVSDGTPCDDGRACTNPDACHAGACTSTAAPLLGCRTPFVGRKAALIVKERLPASRDSLSWKWLKGSATSRADFGDPTASTAYEFCVFDETGDAPSLAMHASIPAGSGWSPTYRGFKYKDPDGLVDGVSMITLKNGNDGSASIDVKAKGKSGTLSMTPLPMHQDSKVIVQLVNPNACWEADYSTNTLNQLEQFKAKAD